MSRYGVTQMHRMALQPLASLVHWDSFLMHTKKLSGLIHYSGPWIFIIELSYHSNHCNRGTLVM